MSKTSSWTRPPRARKRTSPAESRSRPRTPTPRRVPGRPASRHCDALDPAPRAGVYSRPVSPVPPGTEWVVDAHGCDPRALRTRSVLEALFRQVVEELGLHPAGDAVWREFPGEGGITGLLLLTESHLTCHTFPERGFAAFNLYYCRPRGECRWGGRRRDALRAQRVSVRRWARGEP